MQFYVLANDSEAKNLCYLLIKLGIQGMPIQGEDSLKEKLSQNIPINAVILETDEASDSRQSLISLIRERKGTPRTHVILYTSNTDVSFIKNMIEKGITGFIKKDSSSAEQQQAINRIAERVEGRNYQRKHIRIKPDPDDLLRAHFIEPNSGYQLSGKIIDLSLGGMAMELFNIPKDCPPLNGVTINSLSFPLLAHSLTVKAEIVNQSNNYLGIRFLAMDDKGRDRLSRYIFKNIS